MAAIFATSTFAALLILTFVLWRRYIQAGERAPQADTCPYSLTDVFGDHHLLNVPHQQGVRWLGEVFSRSAEKFPDLTALQIPSTGESLTFAELDARAQNVAVALAPFLNGPDQVVAVAMSQDNWQIVAAHLGILKAGAAYLPLDPAYPTDRLTFMLEDSGANVLVTQQSLVEHIPDQAARMICLDTNQEIISQSSEENPGITVNRPAV